jgi:hypothetical protein
MTTILIAIAVVWLACSAAVFWIFRKSLKA